MLVLSGKSKFSKHLDPLVHTGLSCLKFKESTEIVPPHLSLPLPLALRPWEASLLCSSIIVYHDQQCWPGPHLPKTPPPFHAYQVPSVPTVGQSKAKVASPHHEHGLFSKARQIPNEAMLCSSAVDHARCLRGCPSTCTGRDIL